MSLMKLNIIKQICAAAFVYFYLHSACNVKIFEKFNYLYYLYHHSKDPSKQNLIVEAKRIID